MKSGAGRLVVAAGCGDCAARPDAAEVITLSLAIRAFDKSERAGLACAASRPVRWGRAAGAAVTRHESIPYSLAMAREHPDARTGRIASGEILYRPRPGMRQ